MNLITNLRKKANAETNESYITGMQQRGRYILHCGMSHACVWSLIEFLLFNTFIHLMHFCFFHIWMYTLSLIKDTWRVINKTDYEWKIWISIQKVYNYNICYNWFILFLNILLILSRKYSNLKYKGIFSTIRRGKHF